MQKYIDTLKMYFPVIYKEIGKEACKKMGIMKYCIEQYEIRDIGNLSVIKGKSLFGIMKMDTLIITPEMVDAPLFSYDRIRMFGNDTLIVEIYDTILDHNDKAFKRNHAKMMAVRDFFSKEKHQDPGKHWYDGLKLSSSFIKKGKHVGPQFDYIFEEMYDAYITMLQEATVCDARFKKRISAKYVNGLIDNGGPGIDQFVKAMGKQDVKQLFDRVLFNII